MASSAAAPPAPAGREEWVDTLRVVLIAGVIVVHTATGYVTDFAGWYYDDELDPSGPWSIGLAGPAVLGGIFGLGPLFLVAGWFSVASVARRGPGGFVRSRLVRLGLPLALFVLLVNPLADYLGNLNDEKGTFLFYLGITELSVMWFVATLLACSIGYGVIRHVRPAPSARRAPGPRALVGMAATIAAAALLVWQGSSLLDQHLMNVRLGAWPQGIVLFALGVWAAESGSRGELSREAEHRLGLVSLGGLLATAALFLAEGLRGREDDPLEGLGWASICFAVLYGAVSVSFTIWCVSWVRRRWPLHGDLMATAGRASYATYVIHPLVLTLIMLSLAAVPVAAQVKFVLVAVVAVPICFAVGYAFTRTPGLAQVF